MLESFILWLKAQGRSEHTVRRYKIVLIEFRTWLENTNGTNLFLNPSEISAIDIQDWKIYLLNNYKMKNGKKLNVSSVNNKLECIRTFFRYLHESSMIPYSPMVNVKLQKIHSEKQPKWLSRTEKKRLLDYLSDQRKLERNPWKYWRDLAIICTMLHSGLRVCELLALEIDDFDSSYVYVRNGKYGKSRRIEVNKDLGKVMNQWLLYRVKGNSNKIFTSQVGNGALTPSGIANLFRTLSKNTGLTDLTAHSLRHTFGHDLIERGFSIHICADLMGHSDINTTRLYLSSSSEERKKGIESLATGQFDD
ncbi:tyrosine-type recombinase/integrase [Bacillus sp. AFS096315]|uniref:tyrosine-type recombinase/integrase n=1 Tax=Bacillus sp. AFS096315 TaxID=2033517 RepID=UPI000BECFC87|nr:tyrosine-type recombinase/integrase [Bacillus sp. AFS096315]PEC50285.1 integrase [Bacillus sp. AFS096315]